MKHQVHPPLVAAIRNFEGFLRAYGFIQAPEGVAGTPDDRLAVYDCREYRLIFELDRTGDVTVVAQALENRLRGGALDFLLPFLSGEEADAFLPHQAQAQQLTRHHAEVANLLSGRENDRYRAFAQWVEVNWNRLTDERLERSGREGR